MGLDLARPDLAGDRVLIRVAAAALGRAELLPGASESRDVICGGAGFGEVVAAGQSASHLAGKPVVVGPEQACGECDVCRRGAVAVCPGGDTLGLTCNGTLATHVVARARWVCPLDGDLAAPEGKSWGPESCLLGREAAWAYTMLARAGVAPGEPAVVVGGDVVARFLVEIAAARGIRPIVPVPETSPGPPARPSLAEWLEATGAALAVVPAIAGPGDLAALTAARQAVEQRAEACGFGKRPWYVFETSQEMQNRALALALTGPGAQLTVLASGMASGPSGDIEPIAAAGATCIGVAGAHPDLLPEVAALVIRGELDLAGAADVVDIESLTEPGWRPPCPDDRAAPLARALVARIPANRGQGTN